jgi:hypothetical protein
MDLSWGIYPEYLKVKDIPRKPGFYRDAKLRESHDNCGLKPNHYQHLRYSVEKRLFMGKTHVKLAKTPCFPLVG